MGYKLEDGHMNKQLLYYSVERETNHSLIKFDNTSKNASKTKIKQRDNKVMLVMPMLAISGVVIAKTRL